MTDADTAWKVAIITGASGGVDSAVVVTPPGKQSQPQHITRLGGRIGH